MTEGSCFCHDQRVLPTASRRLRPHGPMAGKWPLLLTASHPQQAEASGASTLSRAVPGFLPLPPARAQEEHPDRREEEERQGQERPP
jgi:hypothetical protein